MPFEIQNDLLVKYIDEAGVKTAVIPDGIRVIGDHAFLGCRLLEAVTIPEGVEIIGDYAFYGVPLKSIVIPKGVRSIGDSAFATCRVVDRFVFPEGVEYVGFEAFNWKLWAATVTIHGYTIKTPYSCELDVFAIKRMLEKKHYCIGIPFPIKIMFVSLVYLKTRQPEAEAYIKENIVDVLELFIDFNDYDMIKGLLESGDFVNEKDIIEIAEYSILNTQNGGNVQIQAYIFDYRMRKFPHYSSLIDLKL